MKRTTPNFWFSDLAGPVFALAGALILPYARSMTHSRCWRTLPRLPATRWDWKPYEPNCCAPFKRQCSQTICLCG